MVSASNNTVVKEGNTTTITCEALGYPSPTTVWNRIDGNLSDRVLVSNSVNFPTGNVSVTRVSVNLAITNAYKKILECTDCSANNKH